VKLDDVIAIRYGDVLVEGRRWPNSFHVIEHPEGRVLVDTGMIDSTPELDAEWGVRFDAGKIPRDVLCIVNTHLHVLDLARVEAVARDQGVQHLAREVVAAQLRQRAVPPSDRRADGVDDVRLRHVLILGRAARRRARARSASGAAR
jgi:glyoxylase-like metal-dependent hydrolase (beta-lactamase superfamily II)